jgi:glycosyltransferase involved in cell wall biosynthesis
MADRQLTAPLVSINVPCYRQLPALQRCVASMQAQTFGDFELTLYDDGASDEYRGYVAGLGDGRVRYVRNAERLGAMRNMFHAITAGRGRYTLAFHEDDLLGSSYLEIAVGLLESNPSCGFVAADLHEFEQEPAPDVLGRRFVAPNVVRVDGPAAFVAALTRGVNPMFGSVVYRREAVESIVPPHDRYATLVDRPFLMKILERWSAAIVREPVAWYRAHGNGDARHLAMAPDHILNLFARYRSALPDALTDDERRLFYDFAGYWLFALNRLVPDAAQWPLRRFALQAWRRGLYHPRWSRGVGRKRLAAVMLTGHRQ